MTPFEFIYELILLYILNVIFQGPLMFVVPIIPVESIYELIYVILNIIFQGPLIFVVAMCRTRVAFLFKRYFCQVISHLFVNSLNKEIMKRSDILQVGTMEIEMILLSML